MRRFEKKSGKQATRFPHDLRVYEDLGIAKRILDAGWKIVYDPRAAVASNDQSTMLGLPRGPGISSSRFPSSTSSVNLVLA